MRANRLVGLLMTLGLCGGAVVGCGGSSAEDERLQNEKLEAARAEGRREARAEAATKEAAAQAKKLQKEVDRLKKARGDSKAPTRTSAPSTPAPAPPPSGNSCGGGVSAGNSATTCPFSLNVADVYRGSDGASTIDVYSPVTKVTYTMSCSGGSPTVCRGGNNAVVYIR